MTYVNEDSVLGVGILFTLLGTLAISGRFYVQYRRKQVGVDDWVALAAWALVTAAAALMITGTKPFHPRRSGNAPKLMDEVDRSCWNGWAQSPVVGVFKAAVYQKIVLIHSDAQLEFPFDILQIAALTALKLSVLFFYRRIFVGRLFNIASWTLIGIVIAWGATFIIALMSSCGTHFMANFSTLGEVVEHCINTFGLLIAFAVSDVLVDLIILAIPLPLVMSLHLPLRKRIGILGIFFVGSIATACGIARMALFASILGPKCMPLILNIPNATPALQYTNTMILVFSHTTVGGVSSNDDIGIVSILMFWGMLEIGVAIVAICLPIIYRLARDASPGTFLGSLLSLGSLRGSKTSKNSSLTRLESQQAQGSRSIRRPGYLRRVFLFGPRGWSDRSLVNTDNTGPAKKADDSSADLRAPLRPAKAGGRWPSMWDEDSPAVPQSPVHTVATAEGRRSLKPARGQIWELREIRQTVEVV
ncbi:hypothetical protein BO94DRAFT_575212 [Aspergillus sclerotioniger CBS 115572]|uniref:Rhodopsin domain-containing protein n=1 Tax=Aspergillus sclerotioniger CBS 115572 TaxID=1450535 RepID=A0A317WPA1_9EURO|nr:hypothetical protein BO94DRAFT_575212 [Aspergillus sclerotioniger CBS 115572]PWY87082.1 hypothetical protein BO94DRAFT_575212 [Aspergillus sclerotioniger CBS 115572]